MKIVNIGLVAHVDAGKTTLTEALLLKTGVLRKAGAVDSGTAFTDTMAVERARGISVKAALISLAICIYSRKSGCFLGLKRRVPTAERLRSSESMQIWLLFRSKDISSK